MISCETCDYRDGDYCHNRTGFAYGNFVRRQDFCSRWAEKVNNGYWEEVGDNKYKCSECGAITSGDESDLNYCSKCGNRKTETFWR